MQNAEAIGSRIRTLREHLRLTQADISAVAGVSRSYLSKLENGKEMPGRKVLLMISNGYGVSIDWLTSGRGGMRSPRAMNDREELLLVAFRALPEEEAETHLKLMLQRTNVDQN